MAWIIEPSTDIYLLKDVHIDSNYEHTLYFPRSGSSITQLKTLQAEYFLTTWGKTQNGYFPSNTYQREDLGVIRLNVPRDSIYDANYLMFKNSYFGDKWFYAFIDRVEYVNNNCCRIYYTIDLIQTWYYDFTISRCFVEREHTATDDIGSNLIPEDIAKGRYTTNDETAGIFSDFLKNFSLVIAAPFKIIETITAQGTRYSASTVIDGFYANIPTTLYYNTYRFINYNATTHEYTIDSEFLNRYVPIIDAFLTSNSGLSAVADKIVAIFIFPTYLLSDFRAQPAIAAKNNIKSLIEDVAKPIHGDTLDGYSPKNNKLYTYPYNAIMVSNENGTAKMYEYEKFSNVTAQFKIYGTQNNKPMLQCVPQNYLGEENNFNESIINEDIPYGSWAYSIYQTWVAQNYNTLNFKGIQNAMGVIGSIAQIAAGASAMSMGMAIGGEMTAGEFAEYKTGIADLNKGMGGLMPALGSLFSMAMQAEDIKSRGNDVKCSGSNSIIAGLLEQGFHFKNICLRKEYLEVIDNFFNMYGYAIKNTKIPNVFDPQGAPRPYWNYLKTNGCIIHGANNSCVPADVEKALCTIFDKGITFWNYLYDIGSYELDNSPT